TRSATTTARPPSACARRPTPRPDACTSSSRTTARASRPTCSRASASFGATGPPPCEPASASPSASAPRSAWAGASGSPTGRGPRSTSTSPRLTAIVRMPWRKTEGPPEAHPFHLPEEKAMPAGAERDNPILPPLSARVELGALIGWAPHPALILDREGVIVDANARAEALFDQAAEGLRGRKLRAFLEEDDDLEGRLAQSARPGDAPSDILVHVAGAGGVDATF